MTLSKLATVSALTLALSAGGALAQGMMMGDYDYDTDADAMVSQDEFNAGIDQSGIYDRYDTDADGMLSAGGVQHQPLWQLRPRHVGRPRRGRVHDVR